MVSFCLTHDLYTSKVLDQSSKSDLINGWIRMQLISCSCEKEWVLVSGVTLNSDGLPLFNAVVSDCISVIFSPGKLRRME